ncbi:MAG: GNAT family N-acetyltransferase [Puniceicoccales bacterium]|jgi:GNAT superfamily N-acetyltransferase|nr:GNAT family N-acetyltransferase [Puniceicoccales bacterium]
MSTHVTISSQCNEEDFLSAVRIKGLLKYNMHQTAGKLKVPDMKIVRVARDEQGVIIGGASGSTYLSSIEIEVLWVDEAYRGRHIATRLLGEVEDEARVAGCRLSHLVTYSFQAPQFYEKQGYSICGVVDGFPDHIKLFMLKKSL